MSGYYLMHRGWMDNPIFGGSRQEPYCRRMAWVWLIEHALYEPATVLINNKPVELRRGQLSCSYRGLGEAWGWQHDRCRRLVAALSQLGMVATDVATGQLIITICNYDRYQVQTGSGATTPGVAVRQRRDSGATAIKERKEEGSDADASGAAAPDADPVKEIWERGLAILGPKHRSLLGQMVSRYTKPAVLGAILDTERERPVDPAAFFIRCCERRGNGRGDQQDAYDVLGRAALDYDERQSRGGPAKAAH